ncbi:TetR/AcrR family transcriptional regulator [Mycobacteroides abscessus]|uniref:TetR/AcrR family transcriptional regulator n=1 Tax=Mycobacteroides abscessus TaxID=36809 RepID=UPI001F1F1374|nr:TetR/AcrR family transcriptional regulator [Mycobacteroides abscessus]
MAVASGAEGDQVQAWATARTKKRARLTAEELREHLLDTAVEILSQSGGLTVSLAHLNMEELIRIANVPRSSVYREWKTKEAFYIDLMAKMVEPSLDQGAAWDQETIDVAVAVIGQYHERLHTADGRRAVLGEAARLAVRQNFEAVSQSLAWRTSTALAATLPALEEGDRERLLAALRQAETHFIDKMAAFYEQMMPILGLRPKAPFDLRTFTATASSMIEGLISRSRTNPDVVNHTIMLPGIDGDFVEWHLSAIGYLAILDTMIETDPDYSTPSS